MYKKILLKLAEDIKYQKVYSETFWGMSEYYVEGRRSALFDFATEFLSEQLIDLETFNEIVAKFGLPPFHSIDEAFGR